MLSTVICIFPIFLSPAAFLFLHPLIFRDIRTVDQIGAVIPPFHWRKLNLCPDAVLRVINLRGTGKRTVLTGGAASEKCLMTGHAGPGGRIQPEKFLIHIQQLVGILPNRINIGILHIQN